MDEESGKYILNQVGDHTIKYTAYDEEGNIGTATRVINVEDTILRFFFNGDGFITL